MNSINRTARLTGFLYFMMTPLGILGIIYVPSFLVVFGNASQTIQNLMANELLFRFSILSALTVQVCHIFIVLLLYGILKPVGKNQALLMVIFLLISIPVTIINEMNNFSVLQLLSGSDFQKDQLHAQVMQFLIQHADGIMIVSIFWGLWLLPMGYLVFKSKYIPGILGILLIVTGIGYLMDFVAFILFPDFKVKISTYTGFLEILFPLWLMVKGVNVKLWEESALNSAEHIDVR